MFQTPRSTRISRVGDKKAIATINAGLAFYRNVQKLLKWLPNPKQGNSVVPEDCTREEEARPELSPLALLEFASTMLLLRLSTARDLDKPIPLCEGRMHFDYSKDACDVLAAIYNISLFAKTEAFEFNPRFIRTLHQLKDCVDTYPLGTVILPMYINGCNVSLPMRRLPMDQLDAARRKWYERHCRIRTPGGFPWIPTVEETSVERFIPPPGPDTAQSHLEERKALSEYDEPLPFDVAGFPQLQEREFTDEEKTSAANIFPLQHTIESHDLPNTLIVSDVDGVLEYEPYTRRVSVEEEEQRAARSNLLYKRVDPFSLNAPFVPLPPSNDADEHEALSKVAHLSLSRYPGLGAGHSGEVYSATIQLHIPSVTTVKQRHNVETPGVNPNELLSTGNSPGRRPCDFRFPEKLKVAVKVPHPYGEAAVLNEARIYHDFPQHLSQDYNGFSLVHQGKGFIRAVAVVPKSYGFYVPECKTSSGRKYQPFLLLEECGTRIAPDYSDLSLKVSLPDRKLIYSLIRRLHWAGFVQASLSPRNILVQPGPLHVPHAERTMNDPSYRIIDFGRGLNEERGDFLNRYAQDYSGARARVRERVETEREDAIELLKIQKPDDL